LRAVLAQRLVRRLCPACRERVLAADAPALTPAVTARIEGKPVWRARGCPACLEGYRGRTGLFELMMVDAEMAEAVRTAGSDSRGISELAVRKGMITLLDDGMAKQEQGLTSLSEIIRTIGKFE